MTTLTLTLPWPPRELSPNARGVWPRIRATKAYREIAWGAALEAIGPSKRQLRAPVICYLTFFAKTRRRRDGDNLVAMMKAALDGIVWAGALADDSADVLKMQEPKIVVDPTIREPYVYIELVEALR